MNKQVETKLGHANREIAALNKKLKALQAECAQLVEALEEIIDPIRFMEERLEEGERLNGMAAIQLAEDASYLRGIAIAALAAHQKREEGKMSNQKYVMEPGSLRQRLFNGWAGCSNHGCVVVDPKPGMMRTNGSCQCVVNASRSQLYMLQSRIQSLMAAPQPAAQNPAPDVAGLVEALEECAASLAWNCFGECRAIHAGPIMPAAQALETAREALATHQKREGE